MISKLGWFWSIIILSSGILVSQENSTVFSLSELTDNALENNYLLRANKKNQLIKLADIELLKTNYQPTISASASFSYWKFLLPNKQRLLGNSKTDMYTDITAYQTIYDWGTNKVRKSVVEDEILLNDEIARLIRNTIINGVADTYFEALKAEKEIEVHKNSLDQLNAHLQFVESLYQIGKVSGVDVLKIKVQISVEEKNLEKAQSNLLDRLISLKRMCFLETDDTLQLQNNTRELFESNITQTFVVPLLYDEVLENHPTLLVSEHQINLEIKQKEMYNLQNRPELFGFGIGSWAHGYIPFGNNFNYNIGVGIRYTLPYWGGSSFKHQMVQSGYRIEQISEEKNQAFHDLKGDIDRILNTIKEIKTEIVRNEEIINLATETLNNSTVQYQAGQGSVIDILDAQAILTEARIAHNTSQISYLQALVGLHYLTGSNNYPF